jgi:hypothetical protein
MAIEEQIPLLEEILAGWRDKIGADYAAYRNHVYRMVNFCLALRDCNEEERRKVIIAGCFHDLGIWSDGTVDYLPPSSARARDYLAQAQLEAWIPEVEAMIDEHHKLRRYRDAGSPLVEVFREADLIDVSLGLVKFGLPGAYVKSVKQRFPDTGFHKRLVQLVVRHALTHPLRPLPFYRW